MRKNKGKLCAVLSALTLVSATVMISGDTRKVSALRNDEFIYEIEDNQVVITGLVQTAPLVLEIPDEIDGLPVTSIRTLFGTEREIIIPDTVKEIEKDAFRSSYYLEKAVIPESVTQIGDGAFRSCPKLKYCEIKGEISEIPDGMFEECPELQTVIYPDSVMDIGRAAFMGCSSLEEVEIPYDMTAINAYTFKGCSSLSEIDIPYGVTSIGESAFEGCSSVKSLEIPDTVTVLSHSLFKDCTSLQYIRLPEEAEDPDDPLAGDYLFTNCSSLENIVLPYGITTLGYSCFEGCTSLTNIIIPETVHTINWAAFKDCTGLSFIDLPDNLVVYGNDLFNGCTSLKEVIVPDLTREFGGEHIFKNCTSLEKVVIPSAVDYNANPLNCNSFEGCDNLKELYFMGSISNFGGKYRGYIHDTENNTYTKNEDLTVYCREGSTVQKYASDNELNFKTVSGYDAYVAYIRAYDYMKEEYTEFTSLPGDMKNKNHPAFIYKDGRYSVSLGFGYFTILGDETDAVICTGISAEEYPNFNISPVGARMNSTDMFDLYDLVEYYIDELDGIYYMYVQFEGNDDIASLKLPADTIQLDFEVSGITDEAHNPGYLMGDLDTNGTVNCSDYVIMTQYLLGLRKLSDLQLVLGDLNEDGSVNVLDLVHMKYFFLYN
ncbi:MAG: leucine-rich repeat protein [Oscillospiraceae bacterium]|nr:leucine-rich repeat protein [Oscillospiraceae bacterium]